VTAIEIVDESVLCHEFVRVQEKNGENYAVPSPADVNSPSAVVDLERPEDAEGQRHATPVM
jgi:hypothetical protein